LERCQQEGKLLPITGLILCGGKSSRMGRPKAFLPYAGTTFIEHQIELARQTFEDFFLVTNDPDAFSHFGVTIVEDVISGQGPLGGILSGLLACRTPQVFVVACDMPLVDGELIRKIHSESVDCDACLLAHDHRVEPLFGIYARSCIKPIESFIASGRLKMQDLLCEISLKTVNVPEREGRDDRLPTYFNVNSPQDYSRLLDELALNGPVTGKLARGSVLKGTPRRIQRRF
jgi:molybdopterin-guanine dinucleotide biosynthesis protein A